MGVMYSAYISHPDTSPDWERPPTFDSNYGFESGRQERKMLVTNKEMEAAKLKPEERDYCAHLVIDYYKCVQGNFPLNALCKNQLHEWKSCQYEDFVLRMKEYEREKRLLERAKRKGTRSSAEDLE